MKLSSLFQKSAQPGKPLIAEYNSQQALAYQKQNLHQIHEAKSQMGTNSQGYRALRAISHVLESHRLWEQDPEIGANSIWLYTEGCQSALHILLEHQTAHITWLGSLNGTGRALLEKGLGQSMQRGATKATVKPIWESHGFYQKLGFQDQGNGSWQKPLRESTEDLDETSLEDLLGAIEHEQEQIDSASYGAEGESYQKLDKDFKALEAVSSVVKNNLKALKNPSLGANSIFLYNYTPDTGIFSVAAVHVAIEGSVAHVKWLGSYGKKPGSGKQLLLQALSEAKKMGATQTVVDAKWESDGFYQKQGYRALQPGKFNPFTGSNLVKMSRKLEEGWYKIHEDFSKRALYRYNYRGEKAEYNPDFFDLEDDSLEDEHGKSIATKDKLVPKPHLRHELNLTKNPTLVYRGMSNAEFQQIKKTGKIQSKGGYNLAGQEGLTYFSTDPNSAEFYAHAFAPWQHKANWDNPAWVVAVNKPDPSRVVKVPGTGAHEVGVTGSVDASEIQEIYRGTAVQYHPGVPDQVAPSAWLHWEKVPLSMLTSHSSELQEKWTKKYKKSINCNAPKGFSQRAHCAARRKRRAGGTTTSKSVNEANNTTLSSPVRDQLNAWMELDQQYEDPTKRKSLQAKVWPYIQKNLDAIMSDLGPCNDGDYPAAPFAAWLLVQHMDAFPQNQVTFYKQLAKAIPNHPKLQFLWDRAAVNAWIQKHATNPKYYHDGKPLPDPTINVRNPDMFRDAGIQSTSREQALQNAKQAGNKLLVAAVLATDAQTQPSFTQTQEKRECAEASGTTKSKSVSESRMDTLVESMLHNLQSQGLTEAEAVSYIDERLDENLRKWFKQKWVRFGPDGKIRGACARGKDSEGKPKCLPQKKAWALGKKKRATAARRKRREDPNPERRGKAKNVATKESIGGPTLGILCTIKTNFPEADFWLVRRGDRKNVGKPTKEFSPYHIGIKVTDVEKLMPQYLYYMMMHLHNQGYWLSRSMGTTALLHIRTEDVKNIQLALTEHELKENSSCPQCGGHMVSHTLLNEKKDACYYKVKSRYKVWPSAYASGALVQCRKKGAKNWGNKGKKQ